MEAISQACSEYGFFQIVDHGVPHDLMSRALHLSKTFFEYPDEEKLKSSPGSEAPLPAGYSKQPKHSLDKNEYLLLFPPKSSFNVYPQNPPEFKEVLEEIFSHEAGGLQVRKEGEWIPVMPAEGTIVVNVGDVIQVLSNNKFKSATHRVVRPEGRSRYSFAFFYNLQGDKWIEPLSQFTKEIGEPPKYRGFLFKEYQQMRMRNKSHPPSRPEDVIHITHYAIST
ncbi:flavonol synthase/flavanone 3-hydroxylase-like [Fagus crenata]